MGNDYNNYIYISQKIIDYEYYLERIEKVYERKKALMVDYFTNNNSNIFKVASLPKKSLNHHIMNAVCYKLATYIKDTYIERNNNIHSIDYVLSNDEKQNY